MNPRSEQPAVRRVVILPSGKTVDVVYFDAPERGTARPGAELHRCPACASELVHPVDWREVDRDRWEIRLRCPDCEWRGSGVWDEEAVEQFDATLDHGTHALVRDLHHLARANMEEEIERFATALDADLVLPEDF